MNIHEKLMVIQQKLKAPKNQYNSFGKYNYRSCEDILEGVKPLLAEVKAVLTLQDDVEMIGERFYIRTIAKMIDTESDGSYIQSSAYAREDLDKKGMDLAQVTGSVSSYARKYALNGLFCIDDTKDSDFTNKHGKEEQKPTQKPQNAHQQTKQQDSELLSEPELDRLFDLSDGKLEKAINVINKYGYKSSKEIKKVDYDKIIKEIKAC